MENGELLYGRNLIINYVCVLILNSLFGEYIDTCKLIFIKLFYTFKFRVKVVDTF